LAGSGRADFANAQVFCAYPRFREEPDQVAFSPAGWLASLESFDRNRIDRTMREEQVPSAFRGDTDVNSLDLMLERSKVFAAQQSEKHTLMPWLPQALPHLNSYPPSAKRSKSAITETTLWTSCAPSLPMSWFFWGRFYGSGAYSCSLQDWALARCFRLLSPGGVGLTVEPDDCLFRCNICCSCKGGTCRPVRPSSATCIGSTAWKPTAWRALASVLS
jgi:hypothetical protein